MSNKNYVFTPEGNFISESELYHYGVKGMKWGVRKSYDKYLQIKRKRNKSKYTLDRIANTLEPEKHRGEKFKKAATLSKNYKRTDTKLAWKQAKNKAKTDSTYAQSDEYRKIKQENAKVAVVEALEKLKKTTVLD